MKKKRVIQITAGIFGVTLILFVTLVIHVGMASVVKKNDKRIRQLSRIDFSQNVSHQQASDIKNYVMSLHGVCGANFNENTRILTYMYDPVLLNSSEVYNGLMAHGNYKAEKYTVTANDLGKGCPAFAEKGGFSKAVLFCSNLLFN
jgi:signal transduction histidine kinase